MEISSELLLILFLTGLCAGLIDSIAGGGGLLSLPVLLWAGLNPALVLGTNKLQGSMGTFVSSYHYRRHSHISLRKHAIPIGLTFAGSALGTLLVQSLGSDFLAGIITVLLILFALYFLFSPRLADVASRQRINLLVFSVTLAPLIGFYDGFFGPGTGSFFVMTAIALLGYSILQATALARLLNFTSNISALIFFQLAGLVHWPIGLTMGAGQIIGSQIGSHLGMKHGSKLIRPLLVIVSISLSIKLLIDMPQ